MRSLTREADDWSRMAHEARRKAHEQQDEFSESALQVADLCEYICAAMQRIEQIIMETHKCECGKCPPRQTSGTH